MTDYIPEDEFTAADLLDRFGVDDAPADATAALDALLVGMVEADTLHGDDPTKWQAFTQFGTTLAYLLEECGVDPADIHVDVDATAITIKREEPA